MKKEDGEGVSSCTTGKPPGTKWHGTSNAVKAKENKIKNKHKTKPECKTTRVK